MENVKKFRDFIKDSIRKTFDFRTTDQYRGLPVPSMQPDIGEDDLTISLVPAPECISALNDISLFTAIAKRQSIRRYLDTPLSLNELSWLIWATQGVRITEEQAPFLRTVPSAGARHSFNTYLIINRVESIPAGLYRYHPLHHCLVLVRELRQSQLQKKLTDATLGQRFIATAAAVFIWATVPYRMEWRYGLAAHRVILIDAGHVCENLYLACEAIGCGTCAIGAYDQEAMDKLLGVDGEEEFTVYLAPVGKYNR